MVIFLVENAKVCNAFSVIAIHRVRREVLTDTCVVQKKMWFFPNGGNSKYEDIIGVPHWVAHEKWFNWNDSLYDRQGLIRLLNLNERFRGVMLSSNAIRTVSESDKAPGSCLGEV